MYPRNDAVDAHNERELARLPGKTVEFRAKDDIFQVRVHATLRG